MRRIAHVAVMVGVLVMPRATWAEPPADAELVALLSDYESLPDATVFVTGGPAVASALLQVFQSSAQPTFVRARALRMIGFFPADVAAPLLRQAMGDASSKLVFLREVVGGLVRCGGEHAAAFFAPLLERPERTVRRAAIDALAQLTTPEARVLLTAHREREADPSVRAALDAALGVEGAH